MNDELKSLVADAAKLLGLELIWDGVCPTLFWQTEIGLIISTCSTPSAAI